ncbi:MAG: aminotransferase class I/II-fold pyridoxal phosphate-dependent enzyme [Solirubrobacterales bacterium]|nr:aminotransferase class I/II-fold pyridoxal phosphate-dependent enzyme [Solirubrobacterales bacterium]
MRYRRTAIEIEAPESLGYDSIANNLAESSFADMSLGEYGIDTEVGELLLQYGDHRGDPALREQIAADAEAVAPDRVIVTAGAAPALFIVATALLESGDHVLVQEPNYATNLETPRALAAEVEALPIRYEDGWGLDLDRVRAMLRPQTRLLSITYPHNPTGAMIDAEALIELVGIVEAHPMARLLVDETYRELAYGDPLPVAAGLSTRAISVSSMSKTYGLPGLRIGWLISRDSELDETLLAAKEQILICGSAIDETMAVRILAARGRILPPIRETIAEHLGIVREWIGAQEVFEWVEPQAGVIGLPRFRAPGEYDVDRFYTALLERHGTYVGPGHWFDQPRSSFRLGFGWPATDELRRGLGALLAAAADARL